MFFGKLLPKEGNFFELFNQHADRIVVLEHGQIVENGSHEDLIKKDGLYANLHRIQFSNA